MKEKKKHTWKIGLFEISVWGLFILFWLTFCHAPETAEKKYLYCKMKGTNIKGMSSWDTLIRYTIDREKKHYMAGFPQDQPPYTTKLIGNELSLSSVDNKAVQSGFYREMYESYRLNLDTLVFTRSYFYYISQEDFENGWEGFEKYRNNDLYRMIDLVERPNYIKLAWDKTFWQCEKIPLIKWIGLHFSLGLISIGSAG